MEKRAHLRQLADRSDAIPKAHVAYLESLRALGFMPRVIYDIGACVLHWTREARRIWPEATVIAFDAMTDVRFLYTEAGLDHHCGVLTDRDGVELSFFQNIFFPGGNSYYREIGHPQSATLFTDSNRVQMIGQRLDTVVENAGFPLPDLIKIDTQGAELDVLRGGPKAVAHATRLVVEMQHTQYNEGAPLADETRRAIEAMGFVCTAPLFCNNGPDGDYGFERQKKSCA
jgi:FkbM family methyltransferase